VHVGRIAGSSIQESAESGFHYCDTQVCRREDLAKGACAVGNSKSSSLECELMLKSHLSHTGEQEPRMVPLFRYVVINIGLVHSCNELSTSSKCLESRVGLPERWDVVFSLL